MSNWLTRNAGALLSRGGSRLASGTISMVGGTLRLGAVPVAALVGDELVFSGAGRQYIQESFDDPDAFMEGLRENMAGLTEVATDGAEYAARELAQVGPASTAETFAAGMEWLGRVINGIMGGTAGEWLINKGRSMQLNKDPMVFDASENRMVEVNPASEDPADPAATATPDLETASAELGAAFESAAFEEAMRTEIRARYNEPGFDIQDEAQLQGIVTVALEGSGFEALVGQSDALFTAGDLGNQFSISTSGPRTTGVQIAGQANELFDRIGEALSTSRQQAALALTN